jgi:methionyl-tRNA formyltransferase
MKIFFIGTVSFSLKALEKLVSLNAEIVGVATKSKSTFNSDHEDLSPICTANNIPFKYVKDINAPHIITWIKSLNPDVIFCFGWSSLIKNELLNLTEMGVIGFHPTELPKNRGRHPLIWAIVLGLKETATTFFFMGEGADDGDILSQSSLSINYEDDALDVYKKMEETAIFQIEKFLPELVNGTYRRMNQDHSLSNNWRKRGMKDGEIDFRMSSYAIYNLVRGLTKPYIGAHLFYNQQEVKVWKVREEETKFSNFESGKILEVVNGEILVKTYDKAIRILDHNFQTLPTKGEYL